MHHDSTNPPNGRRPEWRVLLLDRSDAADPLWVLCTVAEPGDVRPARAGDTAPDEFTARWVSARHGLAHIALTALPNPAVWRVDEDR